ncbi:MAG: spore germination protein GerW family protein [Blastococcus sp.]
MKLAELTTSSLRDTMTVSRVYGEPFEHDGVTIIPAAAVRGGAGGGTGKKGETGEEGEGGGFGVNASPAGAFVIKDGSVSWQPAIDVNRIVTVTVLGCVTVTWLLARGRRRRR